ncbi:MAG: hypothetical protein K6A23_06115 [Butyrivibrio sp.]|nr:hypothetical protein [Butyrivibrio sp.]
MFSVSTVQLGWISSAINYCYDHLLSPVFEVISGLMTEILKVFFEYALLPILEVVLGASIEFIGTIFANFIYGELYKLTKLLLWCLDAVEKIFRLFAGIDSVYVVDTSGQYVESGSFIYTLLTSNEIVTALFGIMAASFVLCFLVAIIATVKAMFETEISGNNKRPVGKVLRLTANALLRLILIPIMSLFLILLGDAILKSIDMATNPDQVTISNVIFTMSTLDAVRTDDFDDAPFYNSTTRAAALSGAPEDVIKETSDFGLTDKYRSSFYYGARVNSIIPGVSSLKRDVLRIVLETFDIRRIDYMIAVGCTIMFIYVFGTLAVAMIARAFDVILLILVEPFFAASIPLNDGEKFQKWQDVFMARLGSCYATVAAVNIYLSVIQLILSNKIAFFGPGTTPGVVYLVNLLFVLAGGYTITKAGPIITGIISYDAGTREAETMESGARFTAASMSFVTYPYRKLVSFAFERTTDKMAEGISEMIAGRTGAGDISAQPGKGDAYGAKNKIDSKGTGFDGKKKEDPNISLKNDDSDSILKKESLENQLDKILDEKEDLQNKTQNQELFDDENKQEENELKSLFDNEDKKDDELKSLFDNEDKKDDELKSILDNVEKEDDEYKSLFDSDNDQENSLVKELLEDENKNKQNDDMKKLLDDAFKDSENELDKDFKQNANLFGTKPEDYEYMLMGGKDNELYDPTDYVWIGQQDAENRDRTEKEKMDEYFKTQFEENSLFAAESGTGLDLDGDGLVSGSINDYQTDSNGNQNDSNDES